MGNISLFMSHILKSESSGLLLRIIPMSFNILVLISFFGEVFRFVFKGVNNLVDLAKAERGESEAIADFHTDPYSIR